MKRSREKPIPLETRLGMLAMQYRGTRDEVERAKVAVEYANVVDRLIKSGKWEEGPAFEDMLPDDRLPKTFFEYWDIPCPHGKNGSTGDPKKENG